MKKLLSLFLCLQLVSGCFKVAGQGTYQLFSVTPFTQIEKINGEWRTTVPIDLQYNVIKSFGATSNYFAGVGAGAGISFNSDGNGAINLNIPITGYVGAQLFPNFPSVAFGGGWNLQTGNPILMINLHFVSTAIIPSIQKAAPRYTPLISSDYKRTNIGFKKDN